MRCRWRRPASGSRLSWRVRPRTLPRERQVARSRRPAGASRRAPRRGRARRHRRRAGRARCRFGVGVEREPRQAEFDGAVGSARGLVGERRVADLGLEVRNPRLAVAAGGLRVDGEQPAVAGRAAALGVERLERKRVGIRRERPFAAGGPAALEAEAPRLVGEADRIERGVLAARGEAARRTRASRARPAARSRRCSRARACSVRPPSRRVPCRETASWPAPTRKVSAWSCIRPSSESRVSEIAKPASVMPLERRRSQECSRPSRSMRASTDSTTARWDPKARSWPVKPTASESARAGPPSRPRGRRARAGSRTGRPRRSGHRGWHRGRSRHPPAGAPARATARVPRTRPAPGARRDPPPPRAGWPRNVPSSSRILADPGAVRARIPAGTRGTRTSSRPGSSGRSCDGSMPAARPETDQAACRRAPAIRRASRGRRARARTTRRRPAPRS